MSVDADALAALLLGCPHVRALHSGPHGAIVTDTATGPIPGVLIEPRMIVLGLVVGGGVDQERLAARVRARLANDAPGVPVSLTITRGDDRATRHGPGP